MKKRTLGPLGPVSALTLGGGGIGQLWGPTSDDEAIATLRLAVDSGIDLLDAAPGYNVCEALIGRAFEGRLPAGVRVTTKCGVGTMPAEDIYPRLRSSLEASLAAMRLEHVDLFFLHNPICGDDFAWPTGADGVAWATRLALYRGAVVPAMQRLMADGLIGAWGITGVGEPEALIAALSDDVRPGVVQAVTNLLDSPGSLTPLRTPMRPRDIVAAATAAGVGVMGIRAVQAGALTAAIDRVLPADDPDLADYARAAPFRALCASWSADPAMVAHRYALGMPGVDTVVLGVKNRDELRQCLAAEAAGPLRADELAAIDGLGLAHR